MSAALAVARVLGVEVRVHLTWVLVLGVIVVGLGAVQLPYLYPAWPAPLAWLTGGAVALLYLVSVAAHELAHAVMTRRRGVEPGPLVLYFYGSITPFDSGVRTPVAEAAIAVAGPLTSAILAVVFAGGAQLGLAVGGILGQALAEATFLVAVINALLCAIHLVPAFPFDGGRLVRAVSWRITGSAGRGTRTAARTGAALGLILVGAGLVVTLRDDPVDGLTLILGGLFLRSAAGSIVRQADVEALVSDVRVGDAMERDLPEVSPLLTLDTFAEQYLADERSALPVVDEDGFRGLIGRTQLRRIRRQRWASMRAGDVMLSPPILPVLGPQDALWPAIERLRRSRLDGLPVLDDGSLVGVLTRLSVGRLLGARARARTAQP